MVPSNLGLPCLALPCLAWRYSPRFGLAQSRPFKEVFIADLAGVPSGGFVKKTELVDLMNISDPHDLNGDGQAVFTFPYVTIESVLSLDRSTLLVINDNNYPGTGGRDTNSDHTEFLKIRLDSKLNVERECRGDEERDGR